MASNWYLSAQDYEKVLPWGGHVNKLIQSNTFTNAAWTQTNVGDATFATTTTDPAGGSTMVLLQENTTNGPHMVAQQITITGALQTWCFPVSLKAGLNRTRAVLRVCDSASGTPTNSAAALFDLANGNFVLSSSAGAGFTFVNAGIAPTANSTYRAHIVVQLAASITTPILRVEVDNGSGQAAFSNSYAGTVGNGIYIYGAQLNPGTLPHVYQATTTTAVSTAGSFTANVGDLVRQSANVGLSGSIGGERVFRCTTGGTAGATEPYWTLTTTSGVKGQTTADGGTVVWTEVTGNESWQGTGSSPWLAPAARLFELTGSFFFYASNPTLSSGGTGFAAGDYLRFNTGTALEPVIIKVLTVSAGAILTFAVISNGMYTSNATSGGATVALTGSGSGATFTISGTQAAAIAAAGDTIFVAAGAHYEYTNISTTYAALGTVTNPCSLLVATQNGNKPPVSADLMAAALNGSSYPYALVHSINGNGITFSFIGDVRGIELRSGSGVNTNATTINSLSSRFDNCIIGKLGTGASGAFVLGSVASASVRLNNTSFRMGSANDVISVNGAITWQNSTAFIGTVLSTAVGVLRLVSSAVPGVLQAEGVDFSSMTGTTLVANSGGAYPVSLKDCKLSSTVTVGAAATGPGNLLLDVIRCDSGATNYRNERYKYQGTLTTATAVVRTGGASDGTTPFSQRIAPLGTQNNWRWPFEAFPLDIWNDTSGSATTVTVYGICQASATANALTRLPNNDEIWFDLEYLGSSGSPLGSFASGTKSDILATATAQTADTSAWDTAATLRANTTAYALGAIVKSANNAGRLFMCTAAGTSAGSEPAGFASATDTSGAITDNTATFYPMVRFKMTLTVTPQMKGLLRVYPKCGDQTANRLYFIDPLPVVS